MKLSDATGASIKDSEGVGTITDDAPAPTITPATDNVAEATGGTPAGTVTGTVTVNEPQSVERLTVQLKGSPVAPVGVAVGATVTGAEGTLEITGYDKTTGEITYEYTEDGNAETHNNTGDNVKDIFTFTGTDTAGDTIIPADLTVTITDTVPVANADTNTVTEDTQNSASGNVLGGAGVASTDVADDLNDDTPNSNKWVVGITKGSNGANENSAVGTSIQGEYGDLILQADGSYTYVLDENADALNDGDVKQDVFTYTIRDADGDISHATLTIEVNGHTDAPTLQPDYKKGTEDITLTVLKDDGVLANDTGADGVTLTVTQFEVDGQKVTVDPTKGGTATITSDGVTAGTLTLNADGSYEFVPAKDWSGDVPVVTYTVSDGVNTDTAELQIDITPVTDACAIELGDLNNNTTSGDGNTRVTPTGTEGMKQTVVTVDPDTVTNSNNFTKTNDGGIAAKYIDDRLGSGNSKNITAIDAKIYKATFKDGDGSTANQIEGYDTNTSANKDADAVISEGVVEGTGRLIEAWVYLKKGDKVGFKGYTDDNVKIELAGKDLVWGSRNDAYANFDSTKYTSDRFDYSGTFTVPEEGYYSLKIYNYNYSGTGAFDIMMTTDGSTYKDINTTNFDLYASMNDVTSQYTDDLKTNLNDTKTSATGSDSDVGEGYYTFDINKGKMGQDIEISGINFVPPNGGDQSTAIDTGGLESMTSITLSGLPEGAIVKDGSGHSVTVGADGIANIMGFDYDDITVNTTTPGTHTITVTKKHADTSTLSTGDVTADEATCKAEITLVVSETTAIASTTVNVSEEGLTNGIKDTGGTTDTTDLTQVTGQVAVTAVDTVAFSTTQASKIGNTDVKWSGKGTQTLTAYHDDDGDGQVDTGEEVLVATIDNTGNYNVELKDAVDHTVVGEEDVVSVNLGLTATGSSGTGTGAITVNIEDDSPRASAENVATPVPPIDVNLMLVVDVSGSMSDENRMALTKEALNAAIEGYEDFGDVRVRLVGFSTNGFAVGNRWVNANEAKRLIDELGPGGATHYVDALEEAMIAFDSSGKIEGAINRSVFITDGNPSTGQSVDNSTETKWKAFLAGQDKDGNERNIDSVAIKIDSSPAWSVPAIDPIAFNGATGEDTNGKSVTIQGLKKALLNGINVGVNNGDLIGNTTGSLDSGGFGADGGNIYHLEMDGHTYLFNKKTDTFTPPTTVGSSVYAFDDASNTLSINTSKGGVYVINFDTAKYNYKASKTVLDDYQERIVYKTIDGDGDDLEGNLILDIYRFEARNDVILTNQSTGAIDKALLMANDDTDGAATFDGIDNPDVGTFVNSASTDKINFTIPEKVTLTTNYSVINETSNYNNTAAYAQVINDNDFGKVNNSVDATRSPNSDAENVKIKGSRSYNDTDFYRFNLQAGETVVLDIDTDGLGNSQSLDTWMKLTDASGVELANIDDRCGDIGSTNNEFDAKIVYTADVAGTYFVETSAWGTKTGSYDLWITKYPDALPANFDYSITERDDTDSANVEVIQVTTGTIIEGTAGNETLMGTNGQADNLNAGAGDDVLLFEAGDTINGGAGDDILSLAGLTGSIDLSNVSNIEKVNMTDGKAQTLNISTQDVLDMTNTGKLFIDADSKDSIDQTGFTQQTNSDQTGYTMWTGNGATLYIDENVAAGNII